MVKDRNVLMCLILLLWLASSWNAVNVALKGVKITRLADRVEILESEASTARALRIDGACK